jgi:hypothetical protein
MKDVTLLVLFTSNAHYNFDPFRVGNELIYLVSFAVSMTTVDIPTLCKFRKSSERLEIAEVRRYKREVLVLDISVGRIDMHTFDVRSSAWASFTLR